MAKPRKRYIDDLKPGEVATVGYRHHRWQSTFVGWVLEDGVPRAQFRDNDRDTVWEAYLFEGRICVGSSADTLIVE
jgi:hypothetical protein